jgi:hypothetical protein
LQTKKKQQQQLQVPLLQSKVEKLSNFFIAHCESPLLRANLFSFLFHVAVKIPRFVFDYILMKSESFAKIVATPVILK